MSVMGGERGSWFWAILALGFGLVISLAGCGILGVSEKITPDDPNYFDLCTGYIAGEVMDTAQYPGPTARQAWTDWQVKNCRPPHLVLVRFDSNTTTGVTP